MAQTYSNTPVLSKIKIGESNYYLKDADARAILDTLKSAAFLDADTSITDGATGVAKTAAIKAYVDQAVAVGIQLVVDTQAQGKEEPATTASANTMGKIYLVNIEGQLAGEYTEFITLRSGEVGSYTYAWEKIGTTATDLSNYYTKDEVDDLFDALGDFANADTGTATVNTADSAAFSNGSVSASATYTPAGSVSKPDITVTPTTDTVKVMKTGGSVTAGTNASFTQGTDSFTANTPTTIDTTKFSGGSKAADTFSAGTLPTKAADTFSAGTLPSLGNASTSTFATAGITATVGTGADAETLIFEAATTNTAVTAQGTFDAGTLPTFTEGTFTQGSLPSFTEGAFTPAALAAGFYSAGTAATFTQGTDSFTGGAATQVTLPTFEDATVMTGAAAALDNAPSFTGTEATINSTGTATGSVTLTKTDKTITVNPVPKSGE